jgi:hypothetical protein
MTYIQTQDEAKTQGVYYALDPETGAHGHRMLASPRISLREALSANEDDDGDVNETTPFLVSFTRVGGRNGPLPRLVLMRRRSFLHASTHRVIPSLAQTVMSLLNSSSDTDDEDGCDDSYPREDDDDEALLSATSPTTDRHILTRSDFDLKQPDSHIPLAHGVTGAPSSNNIFALSHEGRITSLAYIWR